MNLRLLELGFALILAVALSSSAKAQFINFDDLSGAGSGEAIPAGYNHLTWNNFDVLDASTTYGATPNGFANGTVSEPNVAYNLGGNDASITSSTPFTLTSLELTAAWNNGLSVEIAAFQGSNLEAIDTVTANATGPALITFDGGFSGINQAFFSSSGGTSAGYEGSGTEFVIDDVSINGAVVPEPSHYGFLVVVAVAGFIAWRRFSNAPNPA